MHVESVVHVRDHSKATGPAHHMLEYIALHTNRYTGEAFELTVERIAHRLQVTTQWVGQLRRQLIDAGELLVEQSRGRRPNVYVIPYERCHACQQANPKVEFGVEDPNPKLTPNQPQTNPKVTEASGPALARIEPSKEVKEVKEETVFSDAPQPQTEKTVARDQSPVQAKAKARTSLPPIGEARRQFIEELTAWAQEGAPGVNAPRFLDLWLLQCEAHHYAWPDWRGMAKWKLREAYYELQDRAARAGQPDEGRSSPSAPVHETYDQCPRCGIYHQSGPCADPWNPATRAVE